MSKAKRKPRQFRVAHYRIQTGRRILSGPQRRRIRHKHPEDRDEHGRHSIDEV